MVLGKVQGWRKNCKGPKSEDRVAGTLIPQVILVPKGWGRKKVDIEVQELKVVSLTNIQ